MTEMFWIQGKTAFYLTIQALFSVSQFNNRTVFSPNYSFINLVKKLKKKKNVNYISKKRFFYNMTYFKKDGKR